MKILVQSSGIDVVPGIIAELRRHRPQWSFVAWPSDERCDYLVCWKPPAELFARQPALRAVINYGAGVDALLAMNVVPDGLPIIRLEDAGMAQQMAEYALYGVLHHHRKFGRYAVQQRARHWQQWEDRASSFRPTVGVMGLGEMGGTVAGRIAAFGYTTLGWARSRHAIDGVECFAGQDGLAPFLARCNVLVSMLPLTADTRGLIDGALLARLPMGAFLINAGRGDQLHDVDVLAALDSGRLAGAMLDVFHTEPLPAHHRFWSHPNVIVTPHIAATTPIRDACEQIVTKIDSLARGEPVSGIVDRVRGY